MKPMRISMRADRRVGVHNLGEPIDAVDPQAARAALDALDGRERTMIFFESDAGTRLLIGGGPELFLVDYEARDESWLLVGDAEAMGEVVLVAGGQAAQFPRAQVVDRAKASEALGGFLEDGSRAPALAWHRRY
jgi:hypothetical protein